MKKLLYLVLFTSFLVSACSNQNNNTQEQPQSVHEQNESLTKKITRNNITPEIPEPLPPTEGGINIEPLPPAKKEDRYEVIYNTKKYEAEKALSKAIEYHNNNKSSEDISFPNKIRVGETISKELTVDNESGKAIKVAATADVEEKEKSHLVKLKVGYNAKSTGTETTGYWEYEVTKNEIKIIDKKVDDHLNDIIT